MKSAPLIDKLSAIAPDSTKTTLRSWIKQGRVTVNGKTITQASHLVEEHEEVKIQTKPKFTDKGDVRIVYQDRFLVAVDKPEGVLSVKAPFEHEKTIHKYLKTTFGPKVKVVHRLDQGTSGVLLFALEEKTYSELKKMFEKHELVRRYTAVVEGQMEENEGTWDSFLWQDEAYMVHSTKDPEQGKRAITHYKVLRKAKNYTLIECTLETGRKNQIRVHASDAGFPITGDPKYGSSKTPIGRLGLHAHYLEFLHPITKKTLKLESSVPEKFLKLFSNA